MSFLTSSKLGAISKYLQSDFKMIKLLLTLVPCTGGVFKVVTVDHLSQLPTVGKPAGGAGYSLHGCYHLQGKCGVKVEPFYDLFIQVFVEWKGTVLLIE